MRIMRKLRWLVLMMFLAVFANAQTQTYSTPFIADRYTEIGTIDYTISGNYLKVIYNITEPGWSLTRTYLHVAASLNGIPKDNHGNPLLCDFDYLKSHGENIDSVVYDSIDISNFNDVYFAAHASVQEAVGCNMDITTINNSVPTGQLYQRVTLNSDTTLSNESYFDMLIYDFNGNQVYFGDFFGNCVDLENPIVPGKAYFPYAVSTYSTDTALLSCIVDKPGNLDIVNYLINQPYDVLYGANAFEVQAAVWTLIDDDTPVNGAAGISWNQTTVNKIINDAIANGEGYVPGCNEYFAVLLDQGCTQNTSVTVQQSIFWLPTGTVPGAEQTVNGKCSGAWGSGERFDNGGWGMYIKF